MDHSELMKNFAKQSEILAREKLAKQMDEARKSFEKTGAIFKDSNMSNDPSNEEYTPEEFNEALAEIRKRKAEKDKGTGNSEEVHGTEVTRVAERQKEVEAANAKEVKEAKSEAKSDAKLTGAQKAAKAAEWKPN